MQACALFAFWELCHNRRFRTHKVPPLEAENTLLLRQLAFAGLAHGDGLLALNAIV